MFSCSFYLKFLSVALLIRFLGLGFAIAETPGGIVVQSIAKGGTADRDGRLQKGDHIVAVDDRSLSGVSYTTVCRFSVVATNKLHF